MSNLLRSKIVSEIIWLVGIVAVSAAIEYAIIVLFELHPILSVKVQGLIGLVLIAYVIRMITRMGDQGLITFVDDDQEKESNGQTSQTN